MDNSIVVVIPTYNERDNIARLIEEIDRIKLPIDILVVDDNSPDNTGNIVESIKKTNPKLDIIHRKKKEGLGLAYIAAFRHILANPQYNYIIEMDGDLSHPTEYLMPMLRELNNFDVVIGSRFAGRLKNINKTPLRILISIIATKYMKLILRLECNDTMSGFIGYKRKVLRSLDYSNFLAKGYVFQAEAKYECKIRGFKMTEIPIIFKNRNWGKSKISIRNIVEALVLPWKIRFFKK